jgi:hypothetical protein
MSQITIQGDEEVVFSNPPSKSRQMNSQDIAELVIVGGRVSVHLLLRRQEEISVMAQRKPIFMLEGEEPVTVRNFRNMLRQSMCQSHE